MISKEAQMIEAFLRKTDSKKHINKTMFSPKNPKKKVEPSRRLQRLYTIETITVLDHPCFVINKRNATHQPQHLIFYFHGGGYTLPASQVHWRLMDRLMTSVDCTIIFVNYPLSPENTCSTTIDMVVAAYDQLTKNVHQEIVLMGDSAGGGLALALAQYLAKHNIIPKPAKIALLSPWLDVSMETVNAASRQPNDYILDGATLQAIGERYAGDLPTKHYLCSPLYGDLAPLGHIAVFTGTNDILNADAHALRTKAEAASQELLYYEYPEMQHIWMGFPIPEAKEALAKLYDFVNRADNTK